MSWQPLVVLLSAFAVAVAVLATRAQRDDVRIADVLARTTGAPGWAVTTTSLGLFGLLVAGEGFYSDVAWHVALGRD